MLNLFKPSLETEIRNDLASLERRITSAELNRITLDAHIDELYSKREYLTDRLVQLANPENANASETFTAGAFSAKFSRTGGEPSPPNGDASQ